jgi:DNA mismatch repair ATPase MutS
MQHLPAEAVYRKQHDTHSDTLKRLLKKRNRIGWLRLAVLVIAIVLSIQAFTAGALIGAVVIVAGIAAFLILVSIDVKNSNQIAMVKLLLQINEHELNNLEGQYQHHHDGAAYLPANHGYAGDLDLFGPSSLYQYTNRCSSEQGRQWLAQNLLMGLPVSEVLERQEAAKELAPLIESRQWFQALSMQTQVTRSMQQKTEAWVFEKELHFTHKAWPVIITVYSVLTLASAVAASLGLIAPGVFSGLFVVYLIIATTLSSRASKAYNNLNGIVKQVSTLHQLLQWIEGTAFKSILLQRLQQSAKRSERTGHAEVKQLSTLLDRFDMRLNIYVFLILNSFLLWDVRQMIALNKWRQHNRERIGAWFHLLGEMEVLNSLATLHFNQPEWTWPTFTDTYFTYFGRAIGHPLIQPGSRVTSDFKLHSKGKVALITGSNMAGKSTFLRSLGVNAVLARIGAPVCAQALLLSPVQILSSMRIADNLAENTSTFYAELKKLKMIIDAMKTDAPLFILLDEVLRGTNSLDRHIGTKALVQQIIKEQSVAVIATHDVEVAKLEDRYPDAMYNYHFDVQVAGEELYFDYKLKEGVCTSLNASLLMKKIGIELENADAVQQQA